MAISIDIDPAFDQLNTNFIQTILENVIGSEGSNVDDISIIFGDDALLNDLKKEYFNKDHFTDVIAFRLNEYEESSVDGEIYISIPRAKENAKSFNEPFEKEICRLIIHGGLHLLNYHDETEEEKNIMTQKENEYLSQWDWNKLTHDK